MRRFIYLLAVPVILFACSSGEKSAERSKTATVQDPLSLRTDPLGYSEADSTADSTLAALPDTSETPGDSLVADMLEQARQHYLSAISAEENGDSVRSAAQFEEAISILDDLSYLPEIENNHDFNDLTKAVIEDYEQYIAKIDSLSPQSSIFALRSKLNQFTESLDTVAATPSTQVVTGTTIPLVVNNLVERNISFFQGKGRHHMEHWLEVAGKYFPLMKTIAREEGVPEEIVHLSMVESGINPLARSWARAVGMWQFVKGTGRLYGLHSNYWFDERRDFEKSTRAMARHIKDLHDEFGDWYLALAAYNSGAGRVYRGIRRSHSTDYWEMRRKLPRETRNYVPEFIAVTLIAMNPSQYGFDGIDPAPPLAFDTVVVNDCVDMDVLARSAGTDVWTMRELNPELIQWCTPPGLKDGYTLRIPDGTKEKFREAYEAIPDDQKRDWIVHVVRRGETLGSIAHKYGIPLGLIQETNHISSPRLLSVGKPLAIPVPKGVDRYASLVASSARYDVEGKRTAGRSLRTRRDRTRVARALAASAGGVEGNTKDYARLTYRVKKGDTIGHIAEWYGCRAANIRNWNDIPYGSILRAGSTLTIWVRKKDLARYEKINTLTFAEKQQGSGDSSSAAMHTDEKGDQTYVVKHGDTLDKIARAHGVSVSQIKGWNHLRRNTILVGQELVLYPEAAQVRVVAKGAEAPASESSTTGKTITYVVKRGDTIWDIAKRHDVQPEDIRSWNELKKNKIVVGQELLIHLN